MEYKCKYFENSYSPNFGQYRSYKIYNALFKMDPNIFINLTHAVLLDESADDSKEHRSILFSFINLLILYRGVQSISKQLSDFVSFGYVS